MSTTEFCFFVALAFGVIAIILGGLLTLGHRLHGAATGRRRVLYGFAIRGFRRDTARNLLIFGCLLAAVGAVGIAVSR